MIIVSLESCYRKLMMVYKHGQAQKYLKCFVGHPRESVLDIRSFLSDLNYYFLLTLAANCGPIVWLLKH